MPIPKPNKGESEDKFMSRCMSDLKSEFPDQKQRAAVCLSKVRKKETKADWDEIVERLKCDIWL